MSLKSLTFVAALAVAAVPLLAQAPPPPAPGQGPGGPGMAPPPALAPNQWRIDGNHSTAAFSVKHMMVSTVHGSFGKVSGIVTYDGKSPASIAVDATIDTASITTNNERRDADLKSPNFFDVANNPTITFKSKKAAAVGAGKFSLVGDLTMHGVTKEVTLAGEGPSAPLNGGRNIVIGASASTTINRMDWGITWNRVLDAGGVTVSNEVAITIEIEANQPNPNAPPPPPRPQQ
jgi:polyisoprenoid-binding protein YceI